MKSNNSLYLLIGVLIAAIVGLGYYIYKEQSEPSGIELKINDSGVSIEQN